MLYRYICTLVWVVKSVSGVHEHAARLFSGRRLGVPSVRQDIISQVSESAVSEAKQIMVFMHFYCSLLFISLFVSLLLFEWTTLTD